MVERTQAQDFDEFNGTLVEVVIEPMPPLEGEVESKGDQYHLEIKPIDEKLLEGSKTGRIHVFLNIPPKATENSVPENSKLDRYISECESNFPDVKKVEKVVDLFNFFKGKECVWRKKKIGQAFKGKEASVAFVPVSEV